MSIIFCVAYVLLIGINIGTNFLRKYRTDKISVLSEELKESIITQMYYNIFLLRRICYSIVSTIFNSWRFMQIQFMILSTILTVIYLLSFKPFNSPLMNKLEIFNEITLLIISYHLLAFTDCLEYENQQYMFGWSMLMVTGLSIVTNSLLNFGLGLIQLKKSITKFKELIYKKIRVLRKVKSKQGLQSGNGDSVMSQIPTTLDDQTMNNYDQFVFIKQTSTQVRDTRKSKLKSQDASKFSKSKKNQKTKNTFKFNNNPQGQLSSDILKPPTQTSTSKHQITYPFKYQGDAVNHMIKQLVNMDLEDQISTIPGGSIIQSSMRNEQSKDMIFEDFQHEEVKVPSIQNEKVKNNKNIKGKKVSKRKIRNQGIESQTTEDQSTINGLKIYNFNLNDRILLD